MAVGVDGDTLANGLLLQPVLESLRLWAVVLVIRLRGMGLLPLRVASLRKPKRSSTFDVQTRHNRVDNSQPLVYLCDLMLGFGNLAHKTHNAGSNKDRMRRTTAPTVPLTRGGSTSGWADRSTAGLHALPARPPFLSGVHKERVKYPD